MRFHHHYQNRDDRRRFARLIHLWIYPDKPESEPLAEFGVELTARRKLEKDFSVRLHFGSRGSETPIDAHLVIAGSGIYVNTSLGRELAHRLTGGKGKDLSLAMHGGQFWWRLWTSEDHCSGEKHNHWSAPPKQGGKYRPWLCRAGNMHASPLDWVLGPRRNEREVVAEAEALVVLPEAIYPVNLKLERWSAGRKRTKLRYQNLSADWEVPRGKGNGIPWLYDHSGGWKGTEVFGSSVKLPDGVEDKDWASIAAALIAAEAVESRVRSGWTPEHQEAVSRG